jgi:hypothetical protein
MSSGAPGTLTAAARAALTAQGWAVNEQNMFTMAAILSDPVGFPGGANDYLDPSETGGAQQALNMIANYDLVASPCTPVNVTPKVFCGAGADPAFQFDLSQPVNNQTANIDGFEVAWQHFFGERLWLQANATIVNETRWLQPAGASGNCPVRTGGLSDSAERRAHLRKVRSIDAPCVQLA